MRGLRDAGWASNQYGKGSSNLDYFCQVSVCSTNKYVIWIQSELVWVLGSRGIAQLKECATLYVWSYNLKDVLFWKLGINFSNNSLRFSVTMMSYCRCPKLHCAREEWTKGRETEVALRCVCGLCAEICSGARGNPATGGASRGTWTMWSRKVSMQVWRLWTDLCSALDKG